MTGAHPAGSRQPSRSNCGHGRREGAVRQTYGSEVKYLYMSGLRTTALQQEVVLVLVLVLGHAYN